MMVSFENGSVALGTCRMAQILIFSLFPNNQRLNG